MSARREALAEPCECCGTTVQYVTVPGAEHNNGFFEPIHGGAGAPIGLRPHTAERCRTARKREGAQP